jgi:carboxylate-amine ligase
VTGPTADRLRAVFDAPEPLTVGLEEEVVLCDPATLQPAPVAADVVARAAGDPRIKLELPAAQVELVTRPHARVADALAELAAARAALVAAADGLARPVAAAVHPTAPALGELNATGRYPAILEEYGSIARRQQVCALQVHVAVGGADRTLAVYNALRSHLPELAALAAAAPFYEGRDTGLASVRPAISTLLPRQGVPPAIESWESFADELRWGHASGAVPESGRWWWELRPHPRFGTLELRVPDVQPDRESTAAVATAAHALVAWLAARSDAGEALDAAPTWRIEENRWSAQRHGVEGSMADLATGATRPTRDVLRARLDEVEPFAQGSLDAARALAECNAAMRLRRIGAERAVTWLADAFPG